MTNEDYKEGARDVLIELASIYSGLTETDIWKEFFPEEEAGE